MAELLIQAKSHWMDNFTQEQIDALDDGRKKSRNARIQLGDIVVVKPDGWTWGREECLPNYLVVKLPQLTVEQVEHFTQSLLGGPNAEGERQILRKRKYQIPSQWVTPYITEGTSVITVTLSNQQQNFINNVIEKTS